MRPVRGAKHSKPWSDMLVPSSSKWRRPTCCCSARRVTSVTPWQELRRRSSRQDRRDTAARPSSLTAVAERFRDLTPSQAHVGALLTR